MRIDVNEQIVIIISDREEKRNQLAQKFYNEAYVWLFAKIFFVYEWVSEWSKQSNDCKFLDWRLSIQSTSNKTNNVVIS